jgi:hypothetical protein
LESPGVIDRDPAAQAGAGIVPGTALGMYGVLT